MKIDENKEKTDLSDHNIVSATFSVLCNQEDQYSETKEIKYLKINDDTKNKFLQDIEEYIRGDEQHDLNEFENVMKKACEDNIMRIIKRKGKHKNVEEIEPVWLTQEIKKQISIQNQHRRGKVDGQDRGIETINEGKNKFINIKLEEQIPGKE